MSEEMRRNYKAQREKERLQWYEELVESFKKDTANLNYHEMKFLRNHYSYDLPHRKRVR